MVTHLFVRAAQLLLAATLASPLTSCIQLESPDSALQAPEQETVLDSAVLPPAMNYDLGEATLVQERFPEDSRFRKMPVRLNGLIATPKAVDAPAPVVVILHGTHPGCPLDEAGVDRWPCDPAVEQPNYQGFEYLVRQLAGRGYVALALNINAENTFGFGEPTPNERLEQLVNLHLQALETAGAGGENNFGVKLTDRVDLTQLALIGHSRGGESAYWLAHEGGLKLPSTKGSDGTPIDGLLLVAPAIVTVQPRESEVPMGIILPACDGDVLVQTGQYFYETARLSLEQQAWASSVWLEQANHNHFNSILPGDLFSGDASRPDCKTLISADQQREFLIRYAGDFLATVFQSEPDTLATRRARMGLDATHSAPAKLYNQSARVAALAHAPQRRALLVPRTSSELSTNALGGGVATQDVDLFHCEAGYYTPEQNPGSEPCQRVNLTVPGSPAMVVASWTEPNAMWRFDLPEGHRDLSQDRPLVCGLRSIPCRS